MKVGDKLLPKEKTEFKCPFCGRACVYGTEVNLIGTDDTVPAIVTHAMPTCGKFRAMHAEQFLDACVVRMMIKEKQDAPN